jgi:hypothetical protein
MTKQEPWFFEERAVAFAKLVLTKQHDVRLYAGTDMALDLLVEIPGDGDSKRRRFGVQIVPSMDLPDSKNADERVLSHLGRDPLEAELPICVFVIGVRKPEGIYRWVVEPVVGDGSARLRRDAEPAWRALDEAGVARLIGQVNAWYDALNGDATRKSRGRHSKAES